MPARHTSMEVDDAPCISQPLHGTSLHVCRVYQQCRVSPLLSCIAMLFDDDVPVLCCAALCCAVLLWCYAVPRCEDWTVCETTAPLLQSSARNRADHTPLQNSHIITSLIFNTYSSSGFPKSEQSFSVRVELSVAKVSPFFVVAGTSDSRTSIQRI